MRIESIRTHLLEHGLAEPFLNSFSGFSSRVHCLVEVVCEDGTVGWGECLGPARLNAATVGELAPHVIGRNPLDTETVWLNTFDQWRDQGQGGVVITALSGIDIALWDIKGKHFGVPIHTLLGGAFRSTVRGYATGGFRQAGVDGRVSVPDEAAGYVAEGFKAIKIKVGYDVDHDAEVIRATRKAIGPDVGLMIDANHGYDTLDAIRLGRAVADQDVGWFEEPVVPEDLASYREVRRGQPIPVAGGETWYTRWMFRAPLIDRAVDIVQPDLCGAGGFTECRRIADMAMVHGVRVVPHVWGTAVAVSAALQFIATLPPAPTRHAPNEPMIELDQTENAFRQAVVTAPLEQTDGVIAVPHGPGLGIEIDREALRQYAMPD